MSQESHLLTTLGLRANSTPVASPTPIYTGYYLVFNFLYGYVLLSSRFLKNRYGLDNNISPRLDITEHGEAAVRSGKISRRQLDLLKRNEAAHANVVEGYPLLVGALLYAHFAGLPAELVNQSALVYTLVRLGYGAAYLYGETARVAGVRTLCWWVGNVACLRLLWLGTGSLNGRRI